MASRIPPIRATAGRMRMSRVDCCLIPVPAALQNAALRDFTPAAPCEGETAVPSWTE
jgi:hypothetical protein